MTDEKFTETTSGPGGPNDWTPAPDADAFSDSSEPVAHAGKPREGGSGAPSREYIADALRTVYDPEIPVNIYELGLIYEMEIGDDGNVKLLMTLTSPGCPVAGILPQQVAEAVASVENVGEVEVSLTWDPPWGMEMMTEEARLALGMF